MDKFVRRWVEKASTDIKTAEILLKSDDCPTESVCFHAQQAVEKLLKAYLTAKGERTGKTHDIATLLEKCISIDEDFENLDR